MLKMRVLEPKQLEERRENRVNSHKKRRQKHSVTFFICLALAAYIVGALAVPLPLLQAETSAIHIASAAPVSMPWPAYGQAAIGALGYGLLDQHGDQRKIPTASVAKVITVVAVLKVKPIKPGESGELLTMTEEDERTYNRFLAEGQSVVKVEAGEQLTEYQAIQALMLPSANNMAEVLARWAFGSVDNYLTFVNPFTKTLGLQNTSIADASGYNPGTQSTAVDLTKLAEIAMNNPVLSEIAAQPQATLPVAGTVYNVNNFLGRHDIVGIKTGNTDEAGGCYMFAARRTINGTLVTVVGVIMGAQTRAQAMGDSLPLIDEAFKGFQPAKPVETGQVVGTVSQTRGEQVSITVKQAIPVLAWGGQTPKAEVSIKNLGRTLAAGSEVGTLTVFVGNLRYDTPVIAAQTISNRSWLWRLTPAGGYL
jgi:D-alanyl-D-alanine carboxypeptidase (penicillin-binding protein 5/6)